MDNRKFVIFVKNKNRTNDIQSCTFKNNIYTITYDGSKQLYLYNSAQVKYYQIDKRTDVSSEDIVITYDKAYKDGYILSLTEINSKEKTEMFVCDNKEYLAHFNCLHPDSIIEDFNNVIVRCNGTIFNSVQKIYVYNYYYKIVFKAGLSKIYDKSSITISQLEINLPTFNYFKDVADILKKSSPLHSYLSDIYNEMLVDNSSILFNYLSNPKVLESKNNFDFFYPFNFNASQAQAIKTAFEHNISIIEAPTGNGKTHTVLNILANAIINNSTIAIVSPNHDWLKKIKNILDEYELGFLVALLDNADNTNYFFDHQPPFPDITGWQRSINEKKAIKKELKTYEYNISYCLKFKNELAIKEKEFADLSTEYEHFKLTLPDNYFDLEHLALLNLSQLTDLLIDVHNYFNINKLSLLSKIRLVWKYDFFHFRTLNNKTEEIEQSIKKHIYIKKLHSLETEINNLKIKISNQNLGFMQHTYLDKAIELFKSYLFAKYDGIQNISFLHSNYKNNFYTFMKKYPVILCTPYTIHTNIKENYMFDYLVLEDADQTDLLSAGVALSCTKRAVLIGDSKKFAHMFDNTLALRASKSAEHLKIDDFAYNCVNNTIMDSVKKLYKDIPSTLLKEHYLSNPKIIGFCNEFFYDNELIIHSYDDSTKQPILCVENPLTNSFKNQEDEQFMALSPYLNLEKYGVDNCLLLTPFMGEFKIDYDGIKLNTFQDILKPFCSTEKSVVLLSTVISEKSRNDRMVGELLHKSNLINNAVSRAIHRFILVTDPNTPYAEESNLKLLMDYINYQNIKQIRTNRNLRPVFSLLTNEFSKHLLNKVVRKIPRNIPQDSLAHTVISRVLSLPEYKNFDWTFGLCLADIVQNANDLMQEEQNFIKNTHFESYFVVYNKSNKLPVLVVDVDNYTPHKIIKDGGRKNSYNFKINILNKNHISYLHWNNDFLGEELSLMNALDRIKKKIDY